MTTTFQLLDQNLLQTNLNLSEMSRIDGSNENFHGNESKILGEIRKHIQKNINSVDKTLGDLEQDLLNNENLLKRNGYKDIIKQKEFEWKTVKAINEAELINAKKELDLAHREIKHFKLLNNLTRQPHIKSNLYKFFSLLIISFMFIYETTTNSNLLSEAVGGFRSGISIATIFASFNIIASFLIGRLVITSFFNIDKTIRRFNYLFFAIYALVLIYFNMALGVFRGLSDQIGIIADSDQLKMLVTEAVTPFDNLSDISFISMSLICLGILFSVVSIIDGYFFDDPYPGYAKYGKRLIKSRKKLIAAREKAILELRKFHNSTIKILEEIKDSRWNANFGWGSCIESLQKIFNEYEKWIIQMSHISKESVLAYRKDVLRFSENPPFDYLNYEIDNEFALSAHEQWPSLSEEYMSDKDKHERLIKNTEIIQSEHSQAIDITNNFFKKELQSIKEYIRNTHDK